MNTTNTTAQHFADSLFADTAARARLERNRILAARVPSTNTDTEAEPDQCYYGCGQRARVNSYYCSVACAIRAEQESR